MSKKYVHSLLMCLLIGFILMAGQSFAAASVADLPLRNPAETTSGAERHSIDDLRQDCCLCL